MCDLRKRVYAAVRAAGCVYADMFARDMLQLLFYELLHGNAVGLCLPAHVGGSFVFEYEAYASHFSLVNR